MPLFEVKSPCSAHSNSRLNKAKPEGKFYLFDYQEQKEWLILSSFPPCFGVETGELGTFQKDTNKSQHPPTILCKNSKDTVVKKPII